MRKGKKALASMGRPVVVFATRSLATAGAVMASTKYQHLVCSGNHGCGAELAFGTDVGIEPLCPNCGNIPEATNHVVDLDPISEDHVASIPCPVCKTHNVLEDEAMGALNGKVHCVACQASLTYTPVTDSDASPLDEIDASDAAKEVVLDNSQPAGPSNPDNVFADDKAIGLGPKGSTQAIHEDEIGKQMLAGTDDGSDSVDVDLDSTLPEDGDVSIQEDEVDARLLAFVAGVPGLTLAKADAGSNADLFHSSKFHNMLVQEASTHGVSALKKYGFRSITVSVPLKKIVEARVATGLLEERRKVTAAVATVEDDMRQCLQIAAVQMAKNFRKDVDNPLQTRLTAALTAVGVKQAKTLVAREMAGAGEAYAQVLLELAADLYRKPVEVRNELADVLSDAAPLDEVTDEEDDTSSEVESRVTAAVRPSRGQQVQTASAVANTSASAMLARVRELSNR